MTGLQRNMFMHMYAHSLVHTETHRCKNTGYVQIDNRENYLYTPYHFVISLIMM